MNSTALYVARGNRTNDEYGIAKITELDDFLAQIHEFAPHTGMIIDDDS
jgi:hypothetical protein